MKFQNDNFIEGVFTILQCNCAEGIGIQGPFKDRAHLSTFKIFIFEKFSCFIVLVVFLVIVQSSELVSVDFVKKWHFFLIVRRAGLLLSQQDFEWRWSVPLFQCLTVLEFSFILFDLCLLITFFNFIMNYVPFVTFWIFAYHKIWILSIMFCFIWSYWIIYFLACL